MLALALVPLILSLLTEVSAQSFGFEDNLNEGSPCYAALEVRPSFNGATLKKAVPATLSWR